MRDVATACDLLRPVWERTRGRDGYVSIEVDPTLAADTEATIAQATHFHEAIARPNLLVKIPATDAGVPAIEEMTARGYSINVTLIFSLSRHRQIAEAYLRGLERLVAAGGDPSRVHSVASFFVSRVDTETDRRLASSTRRSQRPARRSPTPSLPTSNTRSFLRRALGGTGRARGDQATLPLGVDLDEDPSLRDTLYVEELIGPETISTMPEETIRAFQDHGRVERCSRPISTRRSTCSTSLRGRRRLRRRRRHARARRDREVRRLLRRAPAGHRRQASAVGGLSLEAGVAR